MLRISRVSEASAIPGQGLRFAVAGGVVAFFYLAVTVGLADGVGMPFQAALVIGFASAIAAHFLLQRVFVWVHHAEFALPVHVQAARFLLVAALQYAATALATAFLPHALGLSVTAVYLATVVAISALNFFVFRTRVFHARPDACDRWSVADIESGSGSRRSAGDR